LALLERERFAREEREDTPDQFGSGGERLPQMFHSYSKLLLFWCLRRPAAIERFYAKVKANTDAKQNAE
jgi:hypothetical protein